MCGKWEDEGEHKREVGKAGSERPIFATTLEHKEQRTGGWDMSHNRCCAGRS